MKCFLKNDNKHTLYTCVTKKECGIIFYIKPNAIMQLYGLQQIYIRLFKNEICY